MILSWKNQASYNPAWIAANKGGTDYTPNLQNGLDPNDRYILERNGFELEAPQCYMPSLIHSRLSQHGPLWIASHAPLPPHGSGPHIRVVTGMEGDRVAVNDPWPVNTGAQYWSRFNFFFGQMEELGSRELSQPAPVYVAYLAETV